MRLLLPLLGVLLATGCAARAIDPSTGRPIRTADLPETPAWTTESGRLEAQLDIAETLLQTDQSGPAMDIVRKLRAEGVTDPRVDLLQGQILMESGLPSQAEPLLVQAAKRMRRDPRPQRLLGLLYADAHRLDEAIDHLDKATRYAPHHAATWNNLGFLYLTAQRYDDALLALNEAVRLDTAHERYRNNLAYALVYTDHINEALQTFRSTTHNEADAQARLGVALEAAGEEEQALVHYGKALQLAPDQPEAFAGAHRLSGKENL